MCLWLAGSQLTDSWSFSRVPAVSCHTHIPIFMSRSQHMHTNSISHTERERERAPLESMTDSFHQEMTHLTRTCLPWGWPCLQLHWEETHLNRCALSQQETTSLQGTRASAAHGCSHLENGGCDSYQAKENKIHVPRVSPGCPMAWL